MKVNSINIVINIIIIIIGIISGRYVNKEIERNYEGALVLGFIIIIGVLNYYLYNKYGINNHYLSNLVLVYYLLIISTVDLFTKKISLDLIGYSMLSGLLISMVDPNNQTLWNLVLGAGLFIILSFIAKVTKGGIGKGDILLVGVMTISVGIKMALSALIIGLFLCGILGSICLIFKKVSRMNRLPFAPFLLIGIVISII